MKLIAIGFGNLVSAERIVSVVSPESAPIKRSVYGQKRTVSEKNPSICWNRCC